MAFRQALQLAACGLAGGSAAVLFSAVAVGKPRAGGDAEPRVVEAPAWAGAARPGPGVWDPNWDRCGARGWRRARRLLGGGDPPGPLPFLSVRCGRFCRGAGGAGSRADSLKDVAARLAAIGGALDPSSHPCRLACPRGSFGGRRTVVPGTVAGARGSPRWSFPAWTEGRTCL